MDHSLEAYLRRRTDEELLFAIEADSKIDITAREEIYKILKERMKSKLPSEQDKEQNKEIRIGADIVSD